MKQEFNINGKRVLLSTSNANMLRRFMNGAKEGDDLVLTETHESKNCMRVKVCNLRKALKPYGVAIDSVSNRYEMVGLGFCMGKETLK